MCPSGRLVRLVHSGGIQCIWGCRWCSHCPRISVGRWDKGVEQLGLFMMRQEMQREREFEGEYRVRLFDSIE